MSRRGWLIVVVVLGLAGPAAAQSEAELDAARATFAEGVELTQAGRWSEAARRFREVMRVRATIQVKYNLGLALAHTGQLDEAERLLREAAEDETLDEASRDEARRMLAEIEARRGRGGSDEGGRDDGDRGDDGGEGDGSTGGAEGEDGATDGELTEGAESDGEGRAIDRPFTGTRPFLLEAHAGFSFFGFGLATGARFGIPLVHNGFVDSLDNALYLTVGADFYFVEQTQLCDCYGPGLGFPVTLHWQLYFGENLSAFIELGGQLFLHPRLFDTGNFDVYEAGYWVIAAVGGSYRLGGPVHLTLRLGTPYSSLGITIDL